ncbi:MAG: GTP cyclohydrolase MptA [archaeon]|nr:GTP cyclohydrolase MptA [archaeon]
MTTICDVQSLRNEKGFSLTRVGVIGVRKIVQVGKPGYERGSVPMICSIDAFVDLPADQKGSHMSRNLEVIEGIIEECIDKPVIGIENIAVAMGKMLLDKHSYASTSGVNIEAEYFRESVTPRGRRTTEVCKLIGKSRCIKGGKVTKTLGVQVTGMTACPCAQENVARILGCSKEWPVITHNQRNVCTVVMELEDSVDVEADDLIDLVNDCYSSPTFGILKRDDEAVVVINAHNNPKFVEDVVREVLKKIVKQYTRVPDDTVVIARSESEESIHKHNAYAERIATMRELRNQL